MRFSVVVVNYASWPLTLRCVRSVRETGWPGLEMVVVDNGGDEVRGAKLPSYARLIRNKKNLGFAAAANLGIAASSGEVVVLLNPDAVVGEDLFERLAEFFGENPRAGVVGPRVLDPDGGLQLSARREVGFVSGLFGRTSLLTRLFPKSSFVKAQFPAVTGGEGPVEVDWVSGACMAIRREVLDRTGLLDERFFMYFEDADLCRRAREAGWLVHYLPAARVTHAAGGSSRSRPKAVWLLHKSAFLYHRKHGPHGPLNLYSVLVLLGLAARALSKLAASRPAAFRREKAES